MKRVFDHIREHLWQSCLVVQDTNATKLQYEEATEVSMEQAASDVELYELLGLPLPNATKLQKPANMFFDQDVTEAVKRVLQDKEKAVADPVKRKRGRPPRAVTIATSLQKRKLAAEIDADMALL